MYISTITAAALTGLTESEVINLIECEDDFSSGSRSAKISIESLQDFVHQDAMVGALRKAHSTFGDALNHDGYGFNAGNVAAIYRELASVAETIGQRKEWTIAGAHEAP